MTNEQFRDRWFIGMCVLAVVGTAVAAITDDWPAVLLCGGCMAALLLVCWWVVYR